MVLVLYLALVTVIDIEHRLIMHVTSLAGVVIGLGIGVHLHGLPLTLLGGAVGYIVMLSLYLLGTLYVRYMSRHRGAPISEEALGYGDVNLSAIAGLLLGWPGIAVGLLVTILAGGVVSLAVVLLMLLRHKYRPFMAIPYGPFLVLSIAVLLLRP
jgi:prepilin signal peptidase PulO-like enzyme (type II secretory pathway)